MGYASMDFLALAWLTIGALVSRTAADFLLAAAGHGTGRGVFQYDVCNSTWRTVLGGKLFTNDPIAVTYDKMTRRVLWNDHRIQAVRANDLNGGGVTTVFSYASGVAKLTVDGMFMESQSRFLYYTEVQQGIVARKSLATGDHDVLWQDITAAPRDVIVDPDTRMLYWTVWGASNDNSVWQATINGTGAKKLVASWSWFTPNGFHYDKQEQALYICDVFLRVPLRTDIVRIDLISNSAQLMGSLIGLNGNHCYDIAGNATHLFMSDWGESGVLLMKKTSRSDFSILRSISNGRFYGLHYESTGDVTTQSTQRTSTAKTTAFPPSPTESRVSWSIPTTAGIVVGSAVLISILIAVFYCCGKRRAPRHSRQIGEPVPTVTGQCVRPQVPSAHYDSAYDNVYMDDPTSHSPPRYYHPSVPSRDGRDEPISVDYIDL